MDVNKVWFGNYSIGNPKSGSSKKGDEKASEKETQNLQVQAEATLNPESILNALGVAGMQNLAFISKADVQTINPSEFLSQERICDIEAAMEEFEKGVGLVAQTIEAEFPGALAPDKLNALAAKIFAAE